MIHTMKYNKECGLCETPVKRVVDGKLQNTDEYHEVEFGLNNLSTITIAMCSDHLEPSEPQLPEISEKLKKGWAEEVAFGIGNEDWVKNTGMKLEVVGVK